MFENALAVARAKAAMAVAFMAGVPAAAKIVPGAVAGFVSVEMSEKHICS
jgi:hypothetical protein